MSLSSLTLPTSSWWAFGTPFNRSSGWTDYLIIQALFVALFYGAPNMGALLRVRVPRKRTVFDSLKEVRDMTADWLPRHNHYRPNESLGLVSPVEYRVPLT